MSWQPNLTQCHSWSEASSSFLSYPGLIAEMGWGSVSKMLYIRHLTMKFMKKTKKNIFQYVLPISVNLWVLKCFHVCVAKRCGKLVLSSPWGSKLLNISILTNANDITSLRNAEIKLLTSTTRHKKCPLFYFIKKNLRYFTNKMDKMVELLGLLSTGRLFYLHSFFKDHLHNMTWNKFRNLLTPTDLGK